MRKVYFDFSDNAIASASPFNNRLVDEDVATIGTVIADLLDDADATTGKSLIVDAPFSASAAGSSNADSGAGEFNEQSLETNWRTSNGGISTYRIAGFAANGPFTLSLAGHINNTSRHTKFTVNGVSQDYIVGTVANPSGPVVFNGTADENGEITVNVEKADSGEFYGYHNGFILEYSDAPAGPSITLVDDDDIIDVYVDQPVTFTVELSNDDSFTGISSANLNGTDASNISYTNGSGTADITIPAGVAVPADEDEDVPFTLNYTDV